MWHECYSKVVSWIRVLSAMSIRHDKSVMSMTDLWTMNTMNQKNTEMVNVLRVIAVTNVVCVSSLSKHTCA